MANGLLLVLVGLWVLLQAVRGPLVHKIGIS
jgi:hypothetical protein